MTTRHTLFAIALLLAAAAPAGADDARPTTSPDAGHGRRSVTVAFRRQWEPRQKAFTVLVPVGWQVDGGLFSVDPTQAGGALNSVETKCDFSVKRDGAGTVMARWAPTYNFVDFSHLQQPRRPGPEQGPGVEQAGVEADPAQAEVRGACTCKRFYLNAYSCTPFYSPITVSIVE